MHGDDDVIKYRECDVTTNGELECGVGQNTIGTAAREQMKACLHKKI